MRCGFIRKSTPAFEAVPHPAPGSPVVAELEACHAESARTGTLLDATGLQPGRRGWHMHFQGAVRRRLDGPFVKAKAQTAGYTRIAARSRDVALQGSRRFPDPAGEGGDALLEVRALYDAAGVATPASHSTGAQSPRVEHQRRPLQ